jgi:hypothetical protein
MTDAPTDFADRFLDPFAVGWSPRLLDSVRVEMREGKSRRTDCLCNDLHAKWNQSKTALGNKGLR